MPQITIEPWIESDLQLLTRIQGDPDMTRHLGGPETDEKIADRLQRYIASWAPEGRMFKVLCDGEPAGAVGYWERAWQGEDVYEMGWSVLPDFQSRGVATRATELAIERVREDAKHTAIHAFPSIQNEPSNRLCEKLGFTLEGEHDFEYPPGHWMKCNDWSLQLTARFWRARSEPGKEEGSP
jgi:RimJ/RimL family protein N-acetyltransferase